MASVTFKPLVKHNMEELAARQYGIKPSGGILFARHADFDEKAIARQKVLDLFSREAWPGRLHMLTMPGVNWKFERKLLANREPGWMQARAKERDTIFLSCENDRAIFMAAAAQMPGLGEQSGGVRPVNMKKFYFAEMGIKTFWGALLFANVDDVMRFTEWGVDKSKGRLQSGFDAVWLDYTGPLSRERLKLIASFYQTWITGILILTALKARWDAPTMNAINKAGGHNAWVREHINGEILHDIEYMDTSPMAQLAIRKPKPRSLWMHEI